MDAYETTIYSAIIITVLVVGAILIYFGISVFRNQRKHIEIQRVNFLNEVNLLERERTRIARDLHDELGPLLSVTKIHLGNVLPASEQEKKSLDKAGGNVVWLIDRLGEIAANLTPSSLIRKGLRYAVQDFLDDLSEAASKNPSLYKTRFQFLYQVTKEIEPGMGIHIFRIIQEITHNTVKHAGASKLLVQLKERKGVLYLYCKDNGKGFSIEKEMEIQKGLGLRSLQSRATMLCGKMTVNSKPAEGTSYFLEIPFTKTISP